MFDKESWKSTSCNHLNFNLATVVNNGKRINGTLNHLILRPYNYELCAWFIAVIHQLLTSHFSHHCCCYLSSFYDAFGTFILCPGELFDLTLVAFSILSYISCLHAWQKCSQSESWVLSTHFACFQTCLTRVADWKSNSDAGSEGFDKNDIHSKCMHMLLGCKYSRISMCLQQWTATDTSKQHYNCKLHRVVSLSERIGQRTRRIFPNWRQNCSERSFQIL